MGDLAAYDLSAFSIELWVKTTDTGNIRAMLDNIVNSAGYVLDLGPTGATQGRPRLTVGNGTTSLALLGLEVRAGHTIFDGAGSRCIPGSAESMCRCPPDGPKCRRCRAGGSDGLARAPPAN